MVAAGRKDLVGVPDKGLPAGLVETVDLDVNAGGHLGRVLLEDHLVERQPRFQTQPVKERRDRDGRGIHIGGGMAGRKEMEGGSLASDAGVVSGIAVSVVDTDGAEHGFGSSAP